MLDEERSGLISSSSRIADSVTISSSASLGINWWVPHGIRASSNFCSRQVRFLTQVSLYLQRLSIFFNCVNAQCYTRGNGRRW
jgi:hypothetical protein